MEQKPTYEELENSVRQLRATLAAMPDLWFEVDLDGRRYDYHAHDPGLLYLPADKFMGKPVKDILPAEAAAVILSAIAEAKKSGTHKGAVYSLDLPQGRKWFELSISAKGDHTQPGCRFIVLARDVTEKKDAQKAFSRKEELYRTVVESINEGIILQEASGKIVTWNKGAEKVFGIPAEKVIGQTSVSTDWPTIHGDGSKFDAGNHPLMITLKTGSPCTDVIMGVKQPDGCVKWIKVNTNPIFGEHSEKPDAVVISFSDITHLKQIEENLRKSEKDLQQTLDATADGIWSWNFKTNALSFSPKYYKMLGYLPNEFPANFENWVNLIHPEDRERVLAVANEFLRTKPDVYENEFRLKTKTGDYRWARTVGKVVEKDENGDAVYMIGNHEDITERKMALDAFIAERERFELAMRSVNDGLWDWNLKTDEIYYSPVWKKLLGYEDHEIENAFSEWERLTHPDDVKKSWEILNDVLEGKRNSFENEFRMRHRQGHWVDILARAEVMFDENGDGIRVIGTHVDVTERKQLEKQLQQSQKMESIGNLAGGIAHDFNNILFPIIGMAEMILEDAEPGSLMYENAQEIYQAGNRAKDLVSQILSFSRKSDHQMMPVKYQKVLKEVLKLCRSTIPANITIEQDIQQDCGLIWANATQLHQIGMNLITNAYHAVQDMNGTIRVELKETLLEKDRLSDLSLSPGKYLLLSVRDNGTGIPEDIIGNIFDPYFTTKEKSKGTGLGLAVVYGIVKESGGDIQVLSEPGTGTTFTVYLPLMEKKYDPVFERLGSDMQTGHEHILLVDDEPPVARLLQLTLERLGYTVTACNSSVEALEAFKNNPDAFDLIISDMSMPHMTGDQLSHEIRQIRPGMPIVICTGFSERINKKKAEAIGVNGFLLKPIVKSDMARTVRKVLDETRKS